MASSLEAHLRILEKLSKFKPRLMLRSQRKLPKNSFWSISATRETCDWSMACE